jgi:hypothetical protein
MSQFMYRWIYMTNQVAEASMWRKRARTTTDGGASDTLWFGLRSASCRYRMVAIGFVRRIHTQRSFRNRLITMDFLLAQLWLRARKVSVYASSTFFGPSTVYWQTLNATLAIFATRLKSFTFTLALRQASHFHNANFRRLFSWPSSGISSSSIEQG